jgi:hypothetical protein
MATGQVTGLIEDLPSCAELIERLVSQAEAVLAGLAGRNDAGAGDVQDDGSLTGASEGAQP